MIKSNNINNEKFKCPHCNNTVSVLKEGLCLTCYRRKHILKDNYIPFINLSQREQKEILKQREYNKKFNKKVNEAKRKTNKSKKAKVTSKCNDRINLEKEINNNLVNAYKKLNIEEKDNSNVNIIDDVNTILNMINIILYYDKNKCETQKSLISKKIDVIDKYIIDILHNIENSKFGDDEIHSHESKKIYILRQIRRDLKNKEKALEISKKFFNLINPDKDRLNDMKKDLNCFINALDDHYYNPYVEQPKSDEKILGLHKFRCECKVTSPTTNRKIIKYSEMITASNSYDAESKLIENLRQKYGEDVIWSTIYVNFIN